MWGGESKICHLPGKLTLARIKNNNFSFSKGSVYLKDIKNEKEPFRDLPSYSQIVHLPGQNKISRKMFSDVLHFSLFNHESSTNEK